MENVLEELVGSIQDEFDKEAPEITKLSETEFLVNANITTTDVERLLGQELSPKDILSLGAFAIEHFGHIPKKGEKFKVGTTEFIVDSVRDRVIDSMRIRKFPVQKVREKKKQALRG
jgi:putative hemolysin